MMVYSVLRNAFGIRNTLYAYDRQGLSIMFH